MSDDDRSKLRDVLSLAVQKALLSAAKQVVGPLRQLRIAVNQKTGDIHAFAKLLVADKVIDQHQEISLVDAKHIKQRVEVGEELEVDVTPVGFGRVAARFAKQALMAELRRAEERLLALLQLHGEVNRFPAIHNHRRQRTPRYRAVCIQRQWRGAAAAER
jgi:hypothetical protein